MSLFSHTQVCVPFLLDHFSLILLQIEVHVTLSRQQLLNHLIVVDDSIPNTKELKSFSFKKSAVWLPKNLFLVLNTQVLCKVLTVTCCVQAHINTDEISKRQ